MSATTPAPSVPLQPPLSPPGPRRLTAATCSSIRAAAEEVEVDEEGDVWFEGRGACSGEEEEGGKTGSEEDSEEEGWGDEAGTADATYLFVIPPEGDDEWFEAEAGAVGVIGAEAAACEGGDELFLEDTSLVPGSDTWPDSPVLVRCSPHVKHDLGQTQMASEVCAALPINQCEKLIHFETSLFAGAALVRVAGLDNSDEQYFLGRKRKLQVGLNCSSLWSCACLLA